MEIIIDRPYADYAKDIGRMCEQINTRENVNATVFYTGYLDGINNPYVLEWVEQTSVGSVVVIVANDYLTNGSAHSVNWTSLARINKKVIVVTEVSGADQDCELPANCDLVHMGPSLVAEPSYYAQTVPQTTKNLLTGPHWICLNRSTRPQRMLLASVLADLGLGVNGDACCLLKIDSRQLNPKSLVAETDDRFDLIFIDGGHDAETIASDSALAFATASGRASIVWHDFGSIIHTDVTDFINKSAQDRRILSVQGTLIAMTHCGPDPILMP